jgi:hypothetical protein
VVSRCRAVLLYYLITRVPYCVMCTTYVAATLKSKSILVLDHVVICKARSVLELNSFVTSLTFAACSANVAST